MLGMVALNPYNNLQRLPKAPMPLNLLDRTSKTVNDTSRVWLRVGGGVPQMIQQSKRINWTLPIDKKAIKWREGHSSSKISADRSAWQHAGPWIFAADAWEEGIRG